MNEWLPLLVASTLLIQTVGFGFLVSTISVLSRKLRVVSEELVLLRLASRSESAPAEEKAS